LTEIQFFDILKAVLIAVLEVVEMTSKWKEPSALEIQRILLIDERRGMVVISGGLDRMTPWQFDRVAEIDEELKKISAQIGDPPKRKPVCQSKSAKRRRAKMYKPDMSDLDKT